MGDTVATIALHHATGDARIDTLLCGAIGVFEAAFPGRILGYYLFGSHADGSAVANSDIDVFVVFQGDFADATEERRARQLWHACAQLSPVPMDLVPFAEQTLLNEGHFRLKDASLLLAGADIRARMPTLSLDTYLRVYSGAPCANFGGVLRRADTLVFPLSYPDVDSEFFGYDYADPREVSPGVRSIKGLVNSVCWSASILVTFATGRMIDTKAESVRAYRAVIGDRWTSLVETLYAHGKGTWGYRVPDDRIDRALLRDLCRETLPFENHYLTAYRAYLLEHLNSGEIERTRFALHCLNRVIFHDADIRERIQRLTSHDHEAVRRAAHQWLDHVRMHIS